MNSEKCDRCDGCGLIASSKDGEPWTAWTSLPLHSSTAVVMGLVRPLPCPSCAPRPGDLIETECLVCKAGSRHTPEEIRNGKFAPHRGLRFVVKQVTPLRDGRIQIYATSETDIGTPTVLEHTGRDIKIVKRREEIVADTLMEQR